MSNPNGRAGRSRRLAVFSLCAIGLAATPATAGWLTDTVEKTVETVVQAPAKTYYSLNGGSDPTNVSVVSSDMDSSRMPPERQVRAQRVWDVTTGKGIVVAVLDGGFNLRHPDIEHSIVAPFDAIQFDGDVNDTGNGRDDDYDGITDRGVGHGTFVAGMVLRVAPDARIMPIRVRDDEGYGLDTALDAGLRYAIDQRADVINLSVESSDVINPWLEALLRDASEAGITVVISAGNDGREELSDTAKRLNTLAVGAVDDDDRIADFSNFEDGPQVPGGPRMIFAPGVHLYGPLGAPQADSNGYWSGTSFAAPLVSGAVALLLELHPDMTPTELSDRLASKTNRVYREDGSKLQYAGRMNVYKAVHR